MKKKLLSIILSVAVALTMMPAAAGVSFADTSDTTVLVELVKAQTSGSRAVKLSWNKVSGATKYVVYGQKCGKSFKKLKTTSSTSCKVKKIKGKKLKAHKTYKFYVAAYSGNKKLVSSKSIHFITAKTTGKYANASRITAKYSSKTLAPGKKLQLGAAVKIYKNKKHISNSHGAKLRYISNNPGVASVNANGIVTAKKAGTAAIYIQDTGGLWCKTIITVKNPAPTKFTVSFNMHGHGTAPADQKVEKGAKATKPENDPSAAGYTFGGWYTDAEYETEFDFEKEITEATEIHAKWIANTYKVTFKGNFEGSEYSEEVTETYDANYVLPETNPERTGYTFDGWYTAEEEGTKITADTVVKITDAQTLYAHWEIKKCNVTISAGANGVLDPAITASISYNTAITANDNRLKLGTEETIAKPNEGYMFDSWTGIPESGRITKDTDVKATFKIKQYTVSFDLNGHGSAIDPVTVDHGGKVTAPTAPTAEDYTFGGWYKDENCTTAWEFNTDTVTSNTILYAKWTAHEYSTYKFEVTAPETLDTNREYSDASVTLRADSVKDKGYSKVLIKVEMTAKPDGSKPQIIANDGHKDYNLAEAGQWGPSEGFEVAKDYTATTPLKLKFDKAGTYTAKFTLVDLNDSQAVICESSATITVADKTYNITYKDQGDADFSGKHGENHPTTHTYGTKTSLVDATKAGYTFGGWFTTKECTGDAVTELGATAYDADITLYAKWTEHKYSTYKFEVTASETLDTNREYSDASVTLRADSVKDKGYSKVLIKVEMTAKPDGSKPQIIANDGHKDYNLAEAGQWGPSEGFEVAKDYTATTPLKLKFDKAGTYTAKFTLVDLNDSQAVICESSATITVADKTYNITYKDQGDADFSGKHGENHPTTHTYGTKTSLVAATKAGYTFGGWFTTKECTGDAVTELGATTYDADITLYAAWEENYKDAAKAAVSEAASTAKTGINNLIWLSGEQKNNYIAAIDTAVTNANKDIEDAKTKEAIDKAKEKAEATIAEQKTAAENEDNQAELVYKAAAKEETEAKSVASGASIEAMDWLTDEAISKYKEQISKIAVAAKTKINEAAKPADVDAAVSAAQIEIDKVIADAEDAKPDNLTVTFNANGHGTAPEAYTSVGYGKKIDAPTAPTAEGYKFDGWYKEEECTNAWIFDSDTVKDNTTLYAKWTPVYQYNLANDGNGVWKEEEGQSVSSITVLGESVPDPGQTITYTGTDGAQHTVTATANEGYEFDECTYESKTFKAIFSKSNLLPLTITETIGGVEEYVQYFPVAGSGLGEDITFYDADKNALARTGAGGTYQQSDLGGASYYSGKGTFKALRSVNEAWNNVFYIEDEGSGTESPCTADGVKESFMASNLAGGTQDIEQVCTFRRDQMDDSVPRYDGVSLTDIWNTYKSAGFGDNNGTFWSDTADSYINAFCWKSHTSSWVVNYRNVDSCICISREFTAEEAPEEPSDKFPHHDSLEDYSWSELETVANAISDETIPSKEMTHFEAFAESAATKKIDFPDGDSLYDRLYVRIIGFKHDTLSGSNNKAGITFMAANSLNRGYYRNNNDSDSGEYAIGWAASPIRDKLRDGGEIYNRLPSDLKNRITSVTKQSWEDGNIVSTIQTTQDKLFLPSGIELGCNDFEGREGSNDSEGSKYAYIDKDPFDWAFLGDAIAARLTSLNYKGYEYILANKESYANAYNAFDAAGKNGGTVNCNNNQGCWTRSVSKENSRYAGTLYYDGSIWESNVVGPACIAPCFCLGGDVSTDD